MSDRPWLHSMEFFRHEVGDLVQLGICQTMQTAAAVVKWNNPDVGERDG